MSVRNATGKVLLELLPKLLMESESEPEHYGAFD